MLDIILLITRELIRGASEEIIQEKLSYILKKIPGLEYMDEYIKNLLEEKSGIRRALSKKSIISQGISEAHVDYVMEEISVFTSEVSITGEMRSQCEYETTKLACFLWTEYLRVNAHKKNIEYEDEIKKGLYIVAKAWNEPPEEGKEPYIEFLKRIDTKVRITLTEVQDTKEYAKDTNDMVKGMVTSVENTKDMVKEIHQCLLNKSNEEIQICSVETGKIHSVQTNASLVPLSEDLSGENVFNEVNALPDELKICLAAFGDEFQNDVDSLKKFIDEQNSCQNAIRLTLQCYNSKTESDIQKCKYCYILIGEQIDDAIQEIYNQACQQNSTTVCPPKDIHFRLFFKNISGEAILNDNSTRKELEDRYKNDFSQAPLYFNHINRIKLDILQNLREEAPDVAFSTSSILQFKNNADFNEANKRLTALQEQYKELSENENLSHNTEALGKELDAQRELVKKMEKDIWDNLNLLTDKLHNKSSMDAREAQAIESVIEYGDYEKADHLLHDKKWNQQVAALEQHMAAQKEKMRQFISSQRTLISNLKARDTNNIQKEEIINIYERITELSKKWQIEYVTLYEFAEFLLNQRQYDKGIAIGENLKCLYGLSEYTLAEDNVKLLKLLGDLYYGIKKYDSGKRNYEEVFQIFQLGACKNQELHAKAYNDLSKLFWKTNQLAEAQKGLEKNIQSLESLAQLEPQIYEPVLASSYNYMGILQNRKNRLDEAIKHHHQALKIRKRLAKKSSSYNFQPELELSITYNNLAFVYKKMGKYEEADKNYKKSIEIRERNEKKNPSVYRPALALVYSNYSVLLNVNGKSKAAQEYCQKAYDIRNELVHTNPSYEVELANTLHEYGIILTDLGLYPQAKAYLEKAIWIREKWESKDKMTYGLNLAESYCCYGKLLIQMGNFPVNKEYYRKAEQNMKQACDFCNKYAQENKGYDIDKISEIYQAFAEFLSKELGKHSEAKEYYERAIKGWRQLSKQCQQVFDPKLQKAKESLEELQVYISEDF